MKDNKSPEVDGIPPKLLMETAEQINIPLGRVSNLLLKEGMVPFEWKEANIVPLLLNPSQHGSLKERSCLTNILCFLEEIRKWIAEGSPVDIIYLYF